MPKLITLLYLVAIAAIANHASAATQILSSEEQRSVLVELYTSEGCSSCPPADRWLSSLKSDPRLWQQIVPVAFHVDYWNYLGWRDRFAHARYSKRQSDYERHDFLQTVYTPGVMRNGREWRSWSRFDIPITEEREKAGVLKATLRDGDAVVEFAPNHLYQSPLILNIALLGFDLTSRVAAGENAGKILKHDFVVLDFQQLSQAPHDGVFRWEPSGLINGMTEKPSGIALWVTTPNDPTPLQTTGGWLK